MCSLDLRFKDDLPVKVQNKCVTHLCTFLMSYLEVIGVGIAPIFIIS